MWLIRLVFEGSWPEWALNVIKGVFAFIFVAALLLGLLLGTILIGSAAWSILNR